MFFFEIFAYKNQIRQQPQNLRMEKPNKVRKENIKILRWKRHKMNKRNTQGNTPANEFKNDAPTER